MSTAVMVVCLSFYKSHSFLSNQLALLIKTALKTTKLDTPFKAKTHNTFFNARPLSPLGSPSQKFREDMSKEEWHVRTITPPQHINHSRIRFFCIHLIVEVSCNTSI